MKKIIHITFEIQAISDTQSALCMQRVDERGNAAFVEGLEIHRDFQLIIACCEEAHSLREKSEEINLLFKNELNISQLGTEKKIQLISSLLNLQKQLNAWDFTPGNFIYQLVLLTFIDDMKTRFDFHLDELEQGQVLMQEWVSRSWLLLEAFKKRSNASFFQVTLPSNGSNSCSFVLSDKVIAYLEKQIRNQHLLFKKQRTWLNFQYDRIKEHPVNEYTHDREIRLFSKKMLEENQDETAFEVLRFAKFKKSVFDEIKKAIHLMEDLIEIHRRNREAFDPFLDLFDEVTNKILSRLSEIHFTKYLTYAYQTHGVSYLVKKLEMINNWCYNLISSQYLLEVATLYQSKKEEFFSLIESNPLLSESKLALEEMITTINQRKDLFSLADHLKVLEEWIIRLNNQRQKEDLQIATHPNGIFNQNQHAGCSGTPALEF